MSIVNKGGENYILLKDPPYVFKVSTARKYLRHRDFLTYGSQLVPEKIGSETWSLAWAYIRQVDDILDDPKMTTDKCNEFLENEIQIVIDSFNNSYEFKPGEPLRHLWANQFIENIYKYYDNRIRKIVWDLYESAVLDIKRKSKVLTTKEMRKLLYKKAVCFFKLYFLLGKFNFGKYLNDLAETLGLALGMLDDALDMIYDYKSKYINITKEELMELGINVDPSDKDFIKQLIKKGYYNYKSYQIMRLLLRARKLARKIRSIYLRNLILRLTEVFASPILEGRFLPGQQYLFKGGRILKALLPENEMVAYKIGHQLMKAALLFPQTFPRLFNAFFKTKKQT